MNNDSEGSVCSSNTILNKTNVNDEKTSELINLWNNPTIKHSSKSWKKNIKRYSEDKRWLLRIIVTLIFSRIHRYHQWNKDCAFRLQSFFKTSATLYKKLLEHDQQIVFSLPNFKLKGTAYNLCDNMSSTCLKTCRHICKTSLRTLYIKIREFLNNCRQVQ